jgi:hypothetical protein
MAGRWSPGKAALTGWPRRRRWLDDEVVTVAERWWSGSRRGGWSRRRWHLGDEAVMTVER